MPHGASAALEAVLDRSRELGFSGAAPIEEQIKHARGFDSARQQLGLPIPTTAVDLGSGGGLPGLVLAEIWASARVTLLDGSTRRCEFLTEALGELELSDRVSVACGRAEELGRDPALRGSFELAVARSFGPPAVVAECGAPFLALGGQLIVSEPPDADLGQRWPSDGLSQLGFSDARAVSAEAHFAVIELQRACPERYPRRVGVPTKRPLF